MQLKAVALKLHHNFVGEQGIVIEPDGTCVVGKNESHARKEQS